MAVHMQPRKFPGLPWGGRDNVFDVTLSSQGSSVVFGPFHNEHIPSLSGDDITETLSGTCMYGVSVYPWQLSQERHKVTQHKP